MLRVRSALLVATLLVFAACDGGDGSDGGGQDAVSVPSDTTGDDGGAMPDVSPDVPPDAGVDVVADIAPDVGVDVAPDVGVDVEMVERRWVYRAIGGASMGAASAIIALESPDEFDLVGPLGGYIDFTYLQHYMSTRMMGGFCSMEQILENLDAVGDPEAADVFCGPVPIEHPYEHPVDYNHWYFTTNGGNVHRDFYFHVLDDFGTTFGNLLNYSPTNPIAPLGMPMEWVENPDCAAPVSVDYPHNLSREFNPDGEYPLVSFCDGHVPMPCNDDEPPLCGDERPDWWDENGTYRPEGDHRFPVRFAMAVDYNRNGVRDWGEPLVINDRERFEDVGSDGCGDDREDGAGGCTAEATGGDGADPNGDDYDPDTNPTGTEGNWRWDDGEPFDDFGLDGVAADDAAAEDFGENNGVFDVNPNMAAAMAHDPRNLILAASDEDLAGLDFWIDGGRRDMLESAVGTMHTVGALNVRGQEVQRYFGYVERPDTLMPHSNDGRYLSDLAAVDLSAEAIGKNVHMVYGDPDATLAEIRDGNGGHVGDASEIVYRLMTYFAWVAQRWPGVEPEAGGSMPPESSQTLSFYSEALQSRMTITMMMPPGYFDAENAEKLYPVSYFLHGHGMDPNQAVAAIALLFQLSMQQGNMGKFILALPTGWCCYRDSETGLRECACTAGESGHKACVDPACTGPHESCEVRQIPSHRLVRECRQGNFFRNIVSDRWGSTEYVDEMRYGDAMLELLDWVDENYRTMPPAVVRTPASAPE